MRVKLEEEDGNGVTLNKVRYIKADRGSELGELLISNRGGILSIYQNGQVLYTEEKRKGTTRSRGTLEAPIERVSHSTGQ